MNKMNTNSPLVRWLTSLLIAVTLVIAGLFALSSCAPTKEELADNMSGVWRFQSDGMLMTLVVRPDSMRMLVNDIFVPIKMGDVNTDNLTVNGHIHDEAKELGIWTFSLVREDDGYLLLFTREKGEQEKLTFVRKASVEDLARLQVREANPDSGYEEFDPANQARPYETRTWSPSFDCDIATTGAEKLICSSENLSTADVQVAQAFKAKLAVSQDREALLATQRAWRKTERDACASIGCMLAVHQSRLAQLTLPEKPPTPASVN